MKITVNGQNKIVSDEMTIKDLLTQLGIEQKTMASAVNMEVVKKEQWQNHRLKDGDKVEFLHFVGGG